MAFKITKSNKVYQMGPINDISNVEYLIIGFTTEEYLHPLNLGVCSPCVLVPPTSTVSFLVER